MPDNKLRKEIDLADLVASPEELTPEIYQYYKNLLNRKIIFNNQVDCSIVETVILPLLEMDNDRTNKPIEIILCSPGGSPLDGLVLCNIIDNLKTPTTLTALGYMYSMGSVILCSGKNNPNVKKVCYKFSTALIHDGNAFLSGTGGVVKDTQKFYESIDDMIKKYIINNTNIDEDLYDRMERKEWYMTSDEMLKYGLVDEIL